MTGRQGRLILISTAISVAVVLALTLAATVSLNEAVGASAPSLARTNLEQRAASLTPYLAGPAPERSRARRWLQEQGGGISNLELSRSPHVAVAVSSSVLLMAIVDQEGRVVAAKGRTLPPSADAVVRAALAGRMDVRSLTARLGDGSLAAAAPIPGRERRILGALVATFGQLDQRSLLGGALLMTLALGVVVGPLAATAGAVAGFIIGRRAGSGVDPAPAEDALTIRLASAFAALTARELEVLGLLAAADSNAVIAERLHISEKTVKKHVSNILGKLEVPDRTQAAVLAWKRGLVSDEAR